MSSKYGYTTALKVKETMPELLKNVSDSDIDIKISDIEVMFNTKLKGRYVMPISGNIPEDIELATKWQSALVIVSNRFAGQPQLKPLIDQFYSNYKMLAGDVIREIVNGSYQNPDLTPQIKENLDIDLWGYPEDDFLHEKITSMRNEMDTWG